jgi:hypothetical protein
MEKNVLKKNMLKSFNERKSDEVLVFVASPQGMQHLE